MSDPPREPRDEELEELSDDVILAQESAIHVPQRRANVTTDHPTVVISDAATQPERRPTERSRRRTEQTVVIRDRRSLDRMRKQISERQQLKQKRRLVEPRTLYLLALAAVASLLVGTLIAAFVDSRRQERLRATPAVPVRSGPPAASVEAKPIDTVKLDQLPLDRSRRRPPSAAPLSAH